MYSLKHFLYRLILNTLRRFGLILWPLSQVIMHHFSRRLYFEKQNEACPFGASRFWVMYT